MLAEADNWFSDRFLGQFLWIVTNSLQNKRLSNKISHIIRYAIIKLILGCLTGFTVLIEKDISLTRTVFVDNTCIVSRRKTTFSTAGYGLENSRRLAAAVLGSRVAFSAISLRRVRGFQSWEYLWHFKCEILHYDAFSAFRSQHWCFTDVTVVWQIF